MVRRTFGGKPPRVWGVFACVVATSEAPMTEPKAPLSLDELDAKLRGARQADRRGGAEAPGAEAQRGALGLAVRVGVELVSALVVGVGIGYLLDVWLGTKPWLMVVFFFLGAAAGIVNVWRVVSGMGNAVGYAKGTGEGPPEPGSGG
jgi:ATP synthase protein I